MMQGEFTGKKMAAILVAGFGIVVAVNLTMASFAVSSFSGVVVENSYVASENFNDWLDQKEQQQALGWNAQVMRSGAHLAITTTGVPAGASVRADIRRPLGQPEHTVLEASPDGEARFLTGKTVAPGRWIVRLTIQSGTSIWKSESQIE